MSVSDSIGGRIDLAYDVLNRLVRESTAAGSIIYTYDALGRRATMAVNSITVNYTYDADSRLTRVTQGNQSVTIGYDANGRRTTLTYPNGTTTTYSYDAVSRVTGIFHAKGTTSFESISYGYDASGNRTAVVRGSNPATSLPVSMQASYDAANEQVSFSSATPNQTCDANGNLTSRTDSTGTTTYTWDARNRLIAVTGPNLTASFVYDALNRRISKTINGMTTQYLYDRKNVVQEVTSGTVSATYVRSLQIDEPFARLLTNFTNGMEVYHRDALGTTLMLTDESGAVKTTYTYTPFGDTTVTGASSTNPFQYAGRENDGIGLYHYRMRYYSPVLHRFIQEDPIGLMGGVNMYAYVRNNPMRYIDPFGLDKQEKTDEDYPWFWYLFCIIDPNCEPNVPPEFLPYIPTVGGQVGGGDVNPGDLQKVSSREADKIAQQNGYQNAEEMKAAFTSETKGGRFNLSIDKSTGQVVLTPINAGSGPNIPTGVYRKEGTYALKGADYIDKILY
jgi:RHS repeat-associated protein